MNWTLLRTAGVYKVSKEILRTGRYGSGEMECSCVILYWVDPSGCYKIGTDIIVLVMQVIGWSLPIYLSVQIRCWGEQWSNGLSRTLRIEHTKSWKWMWITPNIIMPMPIFLALWEICEKCSGHKLGKSAAEICACDHQQHELGSMEGKFYVTSRIFIGDSFNTKKPREHS